MNKEGKNDLINSKADAAGEVSQIQRSGRWHRLRRYPGRVALEDYDTVIDLYSNRTKRWKLENSLPSRLMLFLVAILITSSSNPPNHAIRCTHARMVFYLYIIFFSKKNYPLLTTILIVIKYSINYFKFFL